MKKLIRILFSVIIVFVLLLSVRSPIYSEEVDSTVDNHVHIYLFHSEYCPHCIAERSFLKDFKKNNSNVDVYEYEVSNNEDNYNLLLKVTDKLDIRSGSVPVTIICGEPIIGFNENGSTSKRIEALVDECQIKGCEDPVKQLLLNEPDDNGQKCSEHSSDEDINVTDETTTQISQDELEVPIFGKIHLDDYSLPMITVILGFLDGFNPCAMWVLLYLISMLFGMKDIRKMWFIGLTFIASSALVYFVFMTSWLNFFLFIGLVKWVRLIIGGIAIASGVIHLKEYWDTRPGCKVTDEEKRKRIQNRINAIVADNRFWIVIVSIMALAFSVNLIELVCSAGFPAIYTHLLSLSDLSTLQYYLYIFLYVFVFMLDDMAIFVIAMITLKATGISSKYKRISSLVGGILILLIGLLLIFKPEILMFS
ncbi:MAG: hypothetical protein ABIC57_03760 [bacterium]